MCWYAQSQQGRWETFSFSRILQLRSSSSLPFIAYSHCLRKASPHTHRQKHLQHRSLPPHTVAASLPAAGIHSSDISARHKLNWKPLTAWGQPERDGDKLQCLVWWGGQKQWLGSWAATSSLYVPLYVHVHVQMHVRVYACIYDVLILFNVHVFFSYFPKSSTNKAAK